MSVGNPRTLNPAEWPCPCVRTHVPALKATHEHHVLPLSWDGPDTAANVVPLCPSSHDACHRLLNGWRRLGHEPADAYTYNRHVRYLAAEGFRRWQVAAA